MKNFLALKDSVVLLLDFYDEILSQILINDKLHSQHNKNALSAIGFEIVS